MADRNERFEPFGFLAISFAILAVTCVGLLAFVSCEHDSFRKECEKRGFGKWVVKVDESLSRPRPSVVWEWRK
jgi:hypothetical protein